MKTKSCLSILLIVCIGFSWIESAHSSQEGYLGTLKSNDPLLGQKNAVVLFASFADINFSMSRNVIEQRVSVATPYFNEVSYGQIAMSFSFDNETLYLPNNLTDYGSTYFGFQGYAQLFTDSVLAASAVNFTRFDYVLLVHSGNSQQRTNDTKYPVTCVLQAPQVTINGTEIMFNAALLSEFDTSLYFCHEICHLLGLPDLYPSAKSPQGDVGCWDLMGQPSWSEIYGNPPELSAWSRIKLGWINDSVIKTINMSDTEDTTMLSNLETAPFWYGDTKVIKVEITTDSYYLVELRNQINSDSDLPSSGILIYRCNDKAQSVNVIDTAAEDFHSSEGYTYDHAALDTDSASFCDSMNGIAIEVFAFNPQASLVTVYRRPSLHNLELSFPKSGVNVTISNMQYMYPTVFDNIFIEKYTSDEDGQIQAILPDGNFTIEILGGENETYLWSDGITSNPRSIQISTDTSLACFYTSENLPATNITGANPPGINTVEIILGLVTVMTVVAALFLFKRRYRIVRKKLGSPTVSP